MISVSQKSFIKSQFFNTFFVNFIVCILAENKKLLKLEILSHI